MRYLLILLCFVIVVTGCRARQQAPSPVVTKTSTRAMPQPARNTGNEVSEVADAIEGLMDKHIQGHDAHTQQKLELLEKRLQRNEEDLKRLQGVRSLHIEDVTDVRREFADIYAALGKSPPSPPKGVPPVTVPSLDALERNRLEAELQEVNELILRLNIAYNKNLRNQSVLDSRLFNSSTSGMDRDYLLNLSDKVAVALEQVSYQLDLAYRKRVNLQQRLGMRNDNAISAQ